MLTPGEIRKTFDEQACARDPGLAAEVEWERTHGTRGWLDVALDREARGGAGRPPC